MSKRNLKASEINFILKDIPLLIPSSLNADIKTKFIDYLLNTFHKELVNIQTYKSLIPQIKENLEKYTRKALIQPGESVGVVCAQSIGERQTQLTLNSFHQSGMEVATVTTGVPRFLEILNCTKDPKISTNTFFMKKDIKTLSQCRTIIGNKLKVIHLRDIIEKETIFLEKEDEPWYDTFELFYSGDFRSYNVCISFKLKPDIVSLYHIYPFQVKEKLEEEFDDICVVFSPFHCLQLDIFVDITSILEDMKEEFAIAHEAGQDLKEHVYITMFLKEFLKPKLKNTYISGVERISNFYLSIKEEQIKVDTEGCNMYDILCLPFVDAKTLKTNHMWEALEIVGIEGVRKFLLNELIQIVSSDGTYINPCHLLLLVDLMTNHGYIQSISRYGIKKDFNSVLTKSSFEESLDHFSKASFFGESEAINSVSASIMCGKRSHIGTGKIAIAMDLEKK